MFDRLFAQNKDFVKKFTDFENQRLADSKTNFFYKDVAEPFIAALTNEIEFTYFDIREFEKALRNADKKDDNQLIALFKLLSPNIFLNCLLQTTATVSINGFTASCFILLG